MKMPKKSRRTYAKSLRAICRKLGLPFKKTAARAALAHPIADVERVAQKEGE